MGKSTKKRAVIYSNVKENKKRAEEQSKIKENQINISDEIIIGMNQLPNDKVKKSQKKQNKKNVVQKKSKNKTSINQNKKKINKKVKSKKKVVNPEKQRRASLVAKIVIAVLVFFIVGFIFLKSSFFSIKEIHVNIANNENITESKIIEISQLEIGQNMYSISKGKIKKNIERNPFVNKVKIKRSLPDKIIINVEERSIKFQLLNEENYIYVDNQGIATGNR